MPDRARAEAAGRAPVVLVAHRVLVAASGPYRRRIGDHVVGGGVLVVRERAAGR